MAQIGVSQAISRYKPKRVLDYGLETGYGFTSLKEVTWKRGKETSRRGMPTSQE